MFRRVTESGQLDLVVHLKFISNINDYTLSLCATPPEIYFNKIQVKILSRNNCENQMDLLMTTKKMNK